MKHLKVYALNLIIGVCLASCQKNELPNTIVEVEETPIDQIDVSALDNEALRYYENMAAFVQISTPDLQGIEARRLRSVTINNEDSVPNPILEEFLNLDIEDEEGKPISFFDLAEDERNDFLHSWSLANAYDMTPKLTDEEIGTELKEYVATQNDAFDEVMSQFEDTCSTRRAKSTRNSNDLYTQISQHIENTVKDKCEIKARAYRNEYLARGSKISDILTSDCDHVDADEVLKQLRKHAKRGDILINLPGSVWLSVYLFAYHPEAITNYVGVGKYPPGHVAIVLQSKGNISEEDVSISARKGDGKGVMKENISHWDCKSHLCYVKKRKWVWKRWRSGFRTVYPNADKVIAYAESKLGTPYCEGWQFKTAKSRTSCFICTTITWRSFDRQGFNIHRLSARWMPTIAPADVLLSTHTKRRTKID